MNGTHMGYHMLQRFTKEPLESLHIFSLRKRSNTAHSRFLQSFALPDEAAQLQLSWGKETAGEPAVKWFGWSTALYTSTTNDLHVSIATSLHQSSLLTLRFSGLVHHLLSFVLFKPLSRSHWKEMRGVCVVSVLSMVFVSVCCVSRHISACVYICKCEVTLCVSELRTRTKFELLFGQSLFPHTYTFSNRCTCTCRCHVFAHFS